MRRLEYAAYGDIRRYIQSLDDDISLRWLIRHFGRGHDVLTPADDTQLPRWIFEDDAELGRYMEQYGYCRTIDDLCPHVPARAVSSCEAIDNPECERFRRYALRERVLEAVTRNSATAAAPSATDAPHALVVQLTADAFEATITQGLEATDGRTRVSAVIETTYTKLAGRLLAGVVTRHAQKQLEADLGRLKELVESESPPPTS